MQPENLTRLELQFPDRLFPQGGKMITGNPEPKYYQLSGPEFNLHLR